MYQVRMYRAAAAWAYGHTYIEIWAWAYEAGNGHAWRPADGQVR